MTVAETSREIVTAWRDVPVDLYREEGLACAAFFVLTSPVLVPVAALFYFSIDREQRDVLDEWRENS